MPTRRRSHSLRVSLLALLLCLPAAGCGQKGDLYLPGKSGSQTLASGAG